MTQRISSLFAWVFCREQTSHYTFWKGGKSPACILSLDCRTASTVIFFSPPPSSHPTANPSSPLGCTLFLSPKAKHFSFLPCVPSPSHLHLWPGWPQPLLIASTLAPHSLSTFYIIARVTSLNLFLWKTLTAYKNSMENESASSLPGNLVSYLCSSCIHPLPLWF